MNTRKHSESLKQGKEAAKTWERQRYSYTVDEHRWTIV